MKTIRISLEKDGEKAVCTHIYRTDKAPFTSTWTGNREPFSYQGRRLTFWDGIDRLELTVAHQAALCGATYQIQDLGGEVKIWIDRVDG